MGKFIRVDEAMNIYDENRRWLYIKGFNGYELSTDGYIRSMKHFKKYPYGILIQPKKSKGKIISPEDPIFTLSNDNNERCDIHLSEIKEICNSIKQNHIHGYPRPTIMIDIASRNQQAFIKRSPKNKPLDNDENKIHHPKFTIIRD